LPQKAAKDLSLLQGQKGKREVEIFRITPPTEADTLL